MSSIKLPDDTEREFSPVGHSFAIRITIQYCRLLNLDFIVFNIRTGKKSYKTFFNVSKTSSMRTQKIFIICVVSNDSSCRPYLTPSIKNIKTYIHFLADINEDVSEIADDLFVLGHFGNACCSCLQGHYTQ